MTPWSWQDWVATTAALTWAALAYSQLVGIGMALRRIAEALEGGNQHGSDWYGKGLNGIAKAIRERPPGQR